MKYKWPIINTIDDILPAIKDRDEFIVAEREWGIVINYMVNYIDTFPEVNTDNEEQNLHLALRRECRGVKFSLDGKIIARPFHKFFNLNERPETLDASINWSNSFNILQKLDGSMIHPILVDDNIIWCTKMGLTDIASQAKEFTKTKPNYEEFSRQMIMIGITPIYEWCSRQQRIVIDYPEDELTLLALRHMSTGEYIPYEHMKSISYPYKIPVVKMFEGTFNNIKLFMDDITTRINEEGYVIRFVNGHSIKVKNLWYLQLHKVKELLRFEKDVIGIVINNSYDDVKAFMEDEDKNRLNKYADDLLTNIDVTSNELTTIVKNIHDEIGNSQKDFANEVLTKHKRNAGLLFNINKGKDPKAVVIDMILKNLGSSSKVERIRHLIGGINWQLY